VFGYGFVTASLVNVLDTLTQLIEQVLEVVGIGGKIRAGMIYMCFNNGHAIILKLVFENLAFYSDS
jgi:hypothetical protein